MLYYQKYDHGFMRVVLAKDEFDTLKSKVTADPNTVVMIKVLLHIVSVIISAINFTECFNAKRKNCH